MGYWSKTWLLCVLFCSSIVLAQFDVSNVAFRGTCANFNMGIKKGYFNEGAFLIETTGARFEYASGKLKIYQGFGERAEDKRQLCTLIIEGEPNFVKAEENDDHILLWSKALNIGVYGDSTIIISPKKNGMLFKFNGSFKPDYKGRDRGMLLLIDDSGGMAIYPQDNEGGYGYKIRNVVLDGENWTAEYQFSAYQRLMIAAFPGKQFDWEKSFKSNIVFIRGSESNLGKMPSDKAIEKGASEFDTIVVWWQGLYKNPDPSGPYLVGNEPEFKRLLQTAHKNGMKVAAYTSFFYYYRNLRNVEPFFDQIAALKEKYGIDGVYIDGLTFDYYGDLMRDNIINWELVRRLRQLFGSEGVIIYHGSGKGSATSTTPNLESYCNATLFGEGISFKSLQDPYIRYQVKKYGISNTIALWKPGPHPDSITEKDIVDAILSMNGRVRVWSMLSNRPVAGKYEDDENYRYYQKRLAEIRKQYINGKSGHTVETPGH